MCTGAGHVAPRRRMPRSRACRGLAHRRTDHHDAADDLDDPVLDRFRAGRLRPPRRARAGLHLDGRRRPQGRLGAAHRHADRRDAGGGEHGVGFRAPLFDRLHARGPVPAAVLRLSVDVHLRHADAGDGGQPGAAVLRLGRRRSCELSADRLLVSQAGSERGRDQGLRRQPRRRLRLCARHFCAVPCSPARSISTPCSRRRRR